MNVTRIAARALFAAALVGAVVTPRALDAQAAHRYDVLLRGGHVMDGTGNPAFRADVGVVDGRIVAVGRLDAASAARVVDVSGRIVAPGFIDIHSHGDDTGSGRRTLRNEDARVRAAPNLVMQGITAVVVNQDGRSAWPIAEQRATMDRLGIGPNALLLVGHGEVRRRAMGDDFRRHATPQEIEAMRALVRQALAEGAWGISAGLEYVPGRWSNTDEVVEVVREIVPYGGVYISHQRAEGPDPMWYWPSQEEEDPPTLIDSVRETIEIGEQTGATVVASHIKAKGATYWGTSAQVIELIEAARARGVQVYADQYPYDTSGTDGNTVLIPGWAYEGREGDFAARLRAALADARVAPHVRSDIAHEIARRGGADKVVIFDHPDASFRERTLAELAQRFGVEPVEMAIRIQLDGYADRRGGARIRGFSMSEVDMDAYAAQRWVATTTDGGIALPGDGPATHARFYGSFPRKIRHFALERGVLSVEDAVRSSTSLPAQIMGLRDRGMIREGMAADIVVFDLARIRDTATFVEPHQYPEGIDHVLVNGAFVVEGGRLTGALPGKVLHR
jgi:N-acyl-D-amino-acid deacylase